MACGSLVSVLLERCIHVCRQREVRKVQGESGRRIRPRDRAPRAMPAPEANAENQSNIDVRTLSHNILSLLLSSLYELNLFSITEDAFDHTR